MDGLIESLKQYLYETLKTAIQPHLWKARNSLPFFLNDHYHFYEALLLAKPCLFMISKGDTEITPSVLRKHWEQVQKHWHGPIIYVQPVLTSYNRKRLIEQHIPFIIPGNQMYLPHVGIDLREYFRKIQKKTIDSVKPGTQTVVLYALLRESNEKLTPSVLKEQLGDYTLMSMSRAFDELQDAEVGEFYREGRERHWIVPDKQVLWEQAKPFLRTPVRKRTWLKSHSFKISAGLSALSHFSRLAPPPLPVFAVGINQWETLKLTGIEELPTPDEASLELEIWNYNPDLFAKDGFVDPISLYLSIEAKGDERVESALEEMVEKMKW